MSLTAVFAATFFCGVTADTFLKIHNVPLSTEEVERTWLAELHSVEKADRVAEIEQELEPMYLALPKSQDGKLDSATVRYALHRYFVQKHGWYLRGVDPNGASYNSSNTASIMKEKAPAYIQGLFEQRLNGHGMTLHDLAAFAATLADLVQQETRGALEKAFRALDLPISGDVGRNWTDKASKSYFMAVFLETGGHPRDMLEFKEYEQQVQEVYPTWEDTFSWMQDVRATCDYWGHGKNPFSPEESFGQTASFIDKVGERFGSFQNLECHALKDKLLDMEYDGSGRVRLSQFYKGGLDGDFMFTESVHLLRSLGALDETNPEMPSVVIPNYIIGQTNCLSSSGFYSICCLDQCEGLLSHIEAEVAHESASPQQIASIVSHLSSDTIDAPRNLSSALLARLDEVAAVHAGQVPLHGRLFSQWMHHAYPRECPFPHVSGTINPMSLWDWVELHGAESLDATQEEMEAHYKAGHHMEQSARQPQSLPWSSVEELVSTRGRGGHASRRKSVISMRDVVAMIALVSFATPLFKVSTKFCSAGKDKVESHLV